jgi:hypothetical protein
MKLAHFTVHTMEDANACSGEQQIRARLYEEHGPEDGMIAGPCST